MIGFHNVRFPEDVSWGSRGGPMFKTQIFESFRGQEKRNIDWSQPIMRFNVAYGVKTDVQMLNLLNFFNARQGRAYGFRYKNWANYRISNAPIATGDGYSTRLPMWKFYGFNGARHYKRLRKIVKGSVTNVGIGAAGTMVEGVDYNINYETGEIALNNAPGYGIPVYAATLEFDEAVRFDTDSMQSIIDGFNNQSLTDLPLIGVKGGFSTGGVFAPIEDASGADDYFESTRLILNFDDITTPTTTIDESQMGTPVVFNGAATMTSTLFKHGGGSLSAGTNGYLSLSGVPYDLGNLPFTLEAFLAPPSEGEAIQPVIGKWDETGTNRCWTLRYVVATKQLQFVVTEDGTTENVLLSYPWAEAQNGVFDYISIDRLSSGWMVLRINGEVKQKFKNGVNIHSENTSVQIGGQANLGASQGSFRGNIDSIRLTVGRNRHPNFDKIDIPSTYPV